MKDTLIKILKGIGNGLLFIISIPAYIFYYIALFIFVIIGLHHFDNNTSEQREKFIEDEDLFNVCSAIYIVVLVVTLLIVGIYYL